jgi:hypothetical protein
MAIVLLQLFSMNARPRVEVMEWIMQEMINLPKEGHTSMYHSLNGNSMLPHARNTAVASFMKTQATDLIMIDDDNYAEVGSINKLLSHKVDVVGASCRRKIPDEERWPVKWHTNMPIKRDENGLIDVESTGTGILRMTRACLEKMVWSERARCYDDAIAGTAWPLFEYAVHDNSWYGEDIEFCRRWRALGGKVYIDPDIKTHHIGNWKYSGSPAEYLAGMPPKMCVAPVKVAVTNEFSKL